MVGFWFIKFLEKKTKSANELLVWDFLFGYLVLVNCYVFPMMFYRMNLKLENEHDEIKYMFLWIEN